MDSNKEKFERLRMKAEQAQNTPAATAPIRKGKEQHTPASNSICIKGILPSVDEEELKNTVIRLINLAPMRVKVVRDKKSGISKGLGFIEFANVDLARSFMEQATSGEVYVKNTLCKLEYSHTVPGAYNAIPGVAATSGVTPNTAVAVNVGPKTFKDWICAKCGKTNFQKNITCFSCQAKKPDNPSYILQSAASTGDPMSSDTPTVELMVRGLDPITSEQTIQRIFGQFAAVKNCRVMKDKSGVSRRFAFVEFFDLNGAIHAHDTATQNPAFAIDNVLVHVSYAKRQHIQTKALLANWNDFYNQNNSNSAQQNASYSAENTAFYANEENYANYNQQESPKKELSYEEISQQIFAKKAAETGSPTTTTTATSETISNTATAQTAVNPMAGYVFDENSGYYYNSQTGYYFDPKTKYFFNTQLQKWLYYDEQTQSYQEVPTQQPQNQQTTESQQKKPESTSTTQKFKKIELEYNKNIEKWNQKKHEKNATISFENENQNESSAAKKVVVISSSGFVPSPAFQTAIKAVETFDNDKRQNEKRKRKFSEFAQNNNENLENLNKLVDEQGGAENLKKRLLIDEAKEKKNEENFDENNIGRKMLSRLGYKKEEGIGKAAKKFENEVLEVQKRDLNQGLGFEDPDNPTRSNNDDDESYQELARKRARMRFQKLVNNDEEEETENNNKRRRFG